MKATAAKKQKQQEIITATLDESAALARVKVIEGELAEIQERLGEEPMRLEDDEDYKVACGLLIATVIKRDAIAVEKEGFMEDVAKLVARVEGWFSRPEGDAKIAEGYFRDAISAYALDLDAKARALREAAAKVKSDKQAELLIAKANAIEPPKVSGISLTRKSKAEVVNEAKLPEWAWKRVPDIKAIEAKLDAGEDVPGAKLVPTVSVRCTPKHAKED
ncbi:MAG: siphovirus Gp157 family protein [Deltaproteobacteria bacterium]|nr:siphovirus Gp157 family protein [Deltaproteobacteria bacterium]